MSKLANMALGQRIEPPNFDLYIEPLDFLLDIGEKPLPNVKLGGAQHHPQLLATFFYEQPIRVESCIHNECRPYQRSSIKHL